MDVTCNISRYRHLHSLLENVNLFLHYECLFNPIYYTFLAPQHANVLMDEAVNEGGRRSSSRTTIRESSAGWNLERKTNSLIYNDQVPSTDRLGTAALAKPTAVQQPMSAKFTGESHSLSFWLNSGLQLLYMGISCCAVVVLCLNNIGKLQIFFFFTHIHPLPLFLLFLFLWVAYPQKATSLARSKLKKQTPLWILM